jgi:hypothetical protein
MIPLETNQSGGKLLPQSDLRGGVFLEEIYLFIDIQRAPLQSNTTYFRVKYSQYGYAHLPLMYNFLYFI